MVANLSLSAVSTLMGEIDLQITLASHNRKIENTDFAKRDDQLRKNEEAIYEAKKYLELISGPVDFYLLL